MAYEKLILKDDMKAAECYERFSRIDPYPHIPAALLNPLDIKRYVQKTGMICPFNENNLKTVTYKIPLFGNIIYWKDGEEYVEPFSEGEEKSFILKPNSIIYIQISTTFRVPYYIAFRFNLKIDLVHKGLLLGTGPVVDPGFQGRIMIPIHNLTANEYKLNAGDGLIWVEFTKLSPYPDRKNGQIYTEFPSMIRSTYEDYFISATKSKGVESSIPNEVSKAITVANQAEQSVSTLKKFGLIGVIALFASIFYPTLSMMNDTFIASREFVKNEESLKKDFEQQKVKLKQLEEKLKKLEKSSHEKN